MKEFKGVDVMRGGGEARLSRREVTLRKLRRTELIGVLCARCERMEQAFLPRLEVLANDLHAPDRMEEASALGSMLTGVMLDHLDKEAALLAGIGPSRVPVERSMLKRLRSEQGVLRAMSGVLLTDLHTIAAGGLPERPNDFVIPTLVFCEFLRKHIAFKQAEIYPRLTEAAADGDRWPAAAGRSRG